MLACERVGVIISPMWQLIKDIGTFFLDIADSKPTGMELKILGHAVDHPCGIAVMKVDGVGRWVRSGDVDLPSDNDNRLSAKYLDALEGLKRKGFVRQETFASGATLETYTLTGRGYTAVENAKQK